MNEVRLYYLDKSFFDNNCSKIQGLKEIWENAFSNFYDFDEVKYQIDDYTVHSRNKKKV